MIKEINIRDLTHLGLAHVFPHEHRKWSDYLYFSIDYHAPDNVYTPYIYMSKPTCKHAPFEDGSIIWQYPEGLNQELDDLSLLDALNLVCDNDTERTYYMLKGKLDVTKILLPVIHDD